MVVWARPARNDLRQLYDIIAKDTKFYARRVVDDIVAKADHLDELPRLGRVVQEIGDENVREFPVYSYRVIYEIVGNQVYILAIVHKRRDFNPADIER